MKLNHLALVIILASSGVLLSCDDTKKPDAKKGEVTATPTETVVEQQKMNAEELADTVEARYKNLIEINNKIYTNTLIGHKNSHWKAVSATIESYTRQEGGAVAKELVTFEPTETNTFLDTKVVMSADDHLTYNEALLAQGIVAQIKHQIHYSDFVSNIKSEKMRAFFEQIFANMSINTDLLTGDNVKTQYDIKPFEFTTEDPDGDKGTLDLAGIQGSYAYNEKDMLENPGSGETEINLSGIKITPESEKGFLTVNGFSFKQSLSAGGDLSIHVTPIKLDFQSEDASFTLDVQKMDLTGTGVQFDPVLGQYLGKNNGTIGDIIITEKGEEPLNIGHIDYSDSTSKDGHNYDLGGKLTFNLNGEALQQKLHAPVQPKSFSATLDIDNLSPETVATLQHFTQVSQTVDQLSEDEQEALVVDTLQKLGASLSANKTELHTHFVLSTDQGEASIDAKFMPPASDDTAAVIDWQQAIEAAEENPISLLMLLQSNIDFTVDIKVSQDLLAAFGINETLVATQTMGMVKNQDGAYIVHIENSSKGLLVNGQPIM